jgi:Protein of unknown function (DUF3108)
MNIMGDMASAAPRKPVLLALTAAVLLAHGLVLLGTPSLWPSSHLSAEQTPGETASASPDMDAAEEDTPSPVTSLATPSVLHSQVRWITPSVAPSLPSAASTPPAPAQEVIKAPPAVPQQALPPQVEVTSTPPDTPAPIESDAAPPPADRPAPDALAAQASPATTEIQHSLSPRGSPSDKPAGTGGTDNAPLAPASTVRDTELTYDVEGLAKGFPFHAQGTLQWRQREDRYEARLEIKAFLLGSRVQTSTGKLGPAGLRPERFSDRARSEKAAHFDQATGRIRFSNNARDIPLLAGAQDRLSVFMQLAALLEARPQAYPPGQTIEMQVAGPGSAEVWSFKVESAAEPLNLPAGEIPAIRLYRAPRLEYDNSLEVWLAPQLHYLPVRIRITQKNGDVADQQLNFVPKVELAR